MNIPNDVDQLAELFEKLGVKDPTAWAKSQLEEGLPHLQSFLFLRQAWAQILDEDDTDWIEKHILQARRHPDGPYAGVGQALQRCLDRGVAPQDLTDIARGIQAQSLFSLCYLLDGFIFIEKEIKDFAWGLFQIDKHDNPIPPRMVALYEMVLDTDPTGREMRPRSKP